MNLELRIPPVIVVILFSLAMWLSAVLLPALNLPIPFSRSLALVISVAGFTVVSKGVREFQKVQTTTDPTRPDTATSLVTSGIYKRSRNPMYLGMLLLLAGWAIYLPNVLSFVLLAAFVAYMTCFQILPEERALTSTFGAEYKVYKQSARRWL